MRAAQSNIKRYDMKTSYQDSTFRIFLDFAKKAISDSGTHLKSRQFDDEVEDGGAVFFVFDSELIARKFVELACGHGANPRRVRIADDWFDKCTVLIDY